MAVEIEVHAREHPDRLATCRLAGWVMSTVLDVEHTDVTVSESGGSLWQARWGTSVSAVVVELPPGSYECPDRWALTFAPGERGIDLSKLFAVVMADAAAVLCDGFLRDEGDLIGRGEYPAGRSLTSLLRHSPTNEATALLALRRPES